MDDKIMAIFCLCDDLLKAMHHEENRQGQMNDADIMTTAFIAALFFRGNHESARALLKQHGYIPHMVSKSRLSRRLHRIKEIFLTVRLFWKFTSNRLFWKFTSKGTGSV